jgi:hypothetical protein
MIESTEKVTTIDGVPVRIWEGTSESGVTCVVMVHRIAVADGQDPIEFERELSAMAPPRHWPLSLVL